MPDDIQRDVDKEHTNGAIPDYENLIEFIKNLSRQSRYHSTQPPKSLTANLVQDEPQSGVEYSIDDWIADIETEGPPDADMGNLPAEGLQALYAIAKGKGRTPKGQGKSQGASKGKATGKLGKGTKGKGKGPFLGKCHNCDETGHMARDCIHQKRNLRPVGDDWNAAPGWTTAAKGNQRVALCVTDHSHVDYRIECPRLFPKHLQLLRSLHMFRFMLQPIMTWYARPAWMR